MFGTRPGSGIGLEEICDSPASVRRIAAVVIRPNNSNHTRQAFSESGRFTRGRFDLEVGF